MRTRKGGPRPAFGCSWTRSRHGLSRGGGGLPCPTSVRSSTRTLRAFLPRGRTPHEGGRQVRARGPAGARGLRRHRFPGSPHGAARWCSQRTVLGRHHRARDRHGLKDSAPVLVLKGSTWWFLNSLLLVYQSFIFENPLIYLFTYLLTHSLTYLLGQDT